MGQTKIHPTAIVDAGAELGDGVEIGAYAVVETGAVLGPGTRIWPQAYVCQGAILGSQVQVHMGAVAGHAPQDFKYKGEPTRLIVGDRVIIREHATLHRSNHPAEPTEVGADCYLMAGSHVAHNCRLGKSVILANGAQLAGHVQVGDRAIVSGNVVIHQFVRIGKLAMLSGGSRFGMDVPPFLIGDGTNHVSGLNIVGLKRCPELEPKDRLELKAAFRILYRSSLSLDEALNRLREGFTSRAVGEWIEFFSQTTPRGCCRYKATRRE